MQTPEQLKATAQTLIELAERLEKEKEAAGPWRPIVDSEGGEAEFIKKFSRGWV